MTTVGGILLFAQDTTWAGQYQWSDFPTDNQWHTYTLDMKGTTVDPTKIVQFTVQISAALVTPTDAGGSGVVRPVHGDRIHRHRHGSVAPFAQPARSRPASRSSLRRSRFRPLLHHQGGGQGHGPGPGHRTLGHRDQTWRHLDLRKRGRQRNHVHDPAANQWRMRSIGDAVISVDTDGSIVQLNPVAEPLTSGENLRRLASRWRESSASSMERREPWSRVRSSVSYVREWSWAWRNAGTSHARALAGDHQSRPHPATNWPPGSCLAHSFPRGWHPRCGPGGRCAWCGHRPARHAPCQPSEWCPGCLRDPAKLVAPLALLALGLPPGERLQLKSYF